MNTNDTFTRILALCASGALTALMVVSTSVLLDPTRLIPSRPPLIVSTLAA